MQFNDGAVDSGGQPEIVGIHNQAGHEAKSINSKQCPGDFRQIMSAAIIGKVQLGRGAIGALLTGVGG